MKFRESGMPPEEVWQNFFNPQLILEQLGVSSKVRTLVDIGCGYGTFLLAASEITASSVIGIDIDPNMINTCRQKIKERSISNAYLIEGDISTDEVKTGIKGLGQEIDYVLLFNLLHCEEPVKLLQDAFDILHGKGWLGVIHWIYDEKTPRGPSMPVRPKPGKIIDWAGKAGFRLEKQLSLPPFHYGLLFSVHV